MKVEELAREYGPKTVLQTLETITVRDANLVQDAKVIEQLPHGVFLLEDDVTHRRYYAFQTEEGDIVPID